MVFANRALGGEALGAEVGAAFVDPSFSYDAQEYIAYCFTCVGRSLEPELQAALVLRDVLELKNEEAARAMGFSLSTFRHRLSAARKQMQERFEDLCSLVNKRGVCYQCSGLREAVPPEKRGVDVPTTLDWEGCLRLVRTAPLQAGKSSRMHQVFFRCTDRQEEQRLGDESLPSLCGQPPADS